MMALLQPWWRDRTPRERLLLAIAAALLLVLLLSLAVLRPMAEARRRAEAEVVTLSRAVAEVARLGTAIRTAERRAGQSTGTAAEIVTRRLAEAGLAADTLTPGPGGEVRLRIPAARAAVLLPWLQAIEQRDGLVIETLTIARNADATVAADIVARRAG